MMFRLLTICAALVALANPLSAAPRDADKAASTAAFLQAVKVLNHPRCMNCHTTVNWPTQGDDQRRHNFNVVRGADDKGAPGLRCTTCHQAQNQTAMNMPGAKDWHIAPLAMGWTGLTPGGLCKLLLDPKKNGGRSGEKVIEHMRADPLVMWAWTPGGTRKAPEISHKAFLASLETWINKGAHCPAP
jgi:hypothetical protein